MIGLRTGLKVGPRLGLAVGLVADEISAGGGEEAVAPAEPIDQAQLNTMLGFGSESVWKHGWLLNESASPCSPFIGAAPIATTGGTPAYGTDGPTDSFDKAVTFTDGQAAVAATSGGAVQIQGHDWAVLAVIRFAAAAPGGSRMVLGHNSTEDLFLQIVTTGRLRVVVVDSVAGTLVSEVVAAHNTGNWMAVLAVGINGGSMRLTTPLGQSTPTSIAAVTAINTATGWQLGQSGACAACDISFMAIAISDDSAEEDAAILDLYNNAATVVSNFGAALGI